MINRSLPKELAFCVYDWPAAGDSGFVPRPGTCFPPLLAPYDALYISNNYSMTAAVDNPEIPDGALCVFWGDKAILKANIMHRLIYGQ